MTSIRRMLSSLLVALLSLVARDAHAAATRPNILFIYTDDLRWDALGVVQREQGSAARFPWLQTPHLDRLAAGSVRFRQSFVATSLCSPGRANVMTSRYGHHTGIIGNSAHLPVETVTIAQQLRAAGYTTGYCGKWHMRDQRERPHYDYAASFVGQGKYFDCPIVVNGTTTPSQGWVDDVTTDYAIRFLDAQPKDKPFFLWVGFKSPHGPRGGENLPERVKKLYANDESLPTPNTNLTAIYNRSTEDAGAGRKAAAMPFESHRDYLRHVTALDADVGRLLDALQRLGQAENTLVILTSDNGYYLREHGLGDKRSAYDESLRVPLLVRLPGPAAAATPNAKPVVNDAMVLNLDYGPTMLDYAGAPPLPEAQGRSFRPQLEGRPTPDWRTAYFYEYFAEANFAAPTVLAVRTSTHKLITYPGHANWTEVFDLSKDPFETTNLAGNRELLAQLKTTFDQQAKSVGFRWPEGYGANGEAPSPPPGKKKKGEGKKAP